MTSSSPLRDFALAFYAHPGVSPACLKLQDEGGVDVLMLIALLYADVRLGRPLNTAGIATLDAEIANWRRIVILPLRRVRVQLKPGWAEVPDANRLALREKVKALELEAEFIQLSAIETWLQAHSSNAGLPLEQALPELLKAETPKDGALTKAFDVVAQAARTLG
ncbi:TIGR02444 family protein [Microvirga zambiensis]|uniref:TIGR02444 family protein n=1 Tax=Microvirga zambiensis TaxID=1402137 RepID=UPI00191D97C9|nr:TIGR02444 family protein [Microvirga zambiensis]